jgi:hypothetical protein
MFDRVIRRTSKNWTRDTHCHWFLFVFFYIVIANIPFWAASRWLGLWGHGLFCLEYAVVGLLALVVPGGVAATLLSVVIVADLTCGVSQTYFLSPWECLTNIGDLHELGGSRPVAVGIVIVLTLLISVIAACLPLSLSRTSYHSRAAGCLVAFVILAVLIDFTSMVRAAGTMPNLLRFSRGDGVKHIYFEEPRLSRPITFRLLRNEMFYRGIHKGAASSKGVTSPVPSASALAVQLAEHATRSGGPEMPNIVVVVVESWGIDLDSSIRQAITQHYSQTDLLARYDVSQGTVPFDGATIHGEGRELCGSKIGFHLLTATKPELQGCLPDRLRALGYRTVALHGMDGHMFDRRTWYRTIGFDDVWFRDRFQKQGLPDCDGAFTGTCDAAIAEWIGQRLEGQGTRQNFVYWMTLNSHLPVPVPSYLRDGASCSISTALLQQPSLCSWYQLVSNVHDSVARLAMTRLARPTVFVIVGDHAPPFANPAARSQFSTTDVPYVLLVPRQNSRVARWKQP